MRTPQRTGFTLVELLVVIGIIGVLVALLLPAIMGAREAARRMSCTNNMKQIGLAMQTYHDTFKQFPPGYRFMSGSAVEGYGTGFVSLLPFLEQANLKNLADPQLPWYHLSPSVAQQRVSTFECPSDAAANPSVYSWITPLGLPVGDTFANSSYAFSLGFNDALCFGPHYGPRPVNERSGVFAFHSETRHRDILDGTSTTFAVGEAASGFRLGTGLRSSVPLPGRNSNHGWLVGGHNLEPYYAGGFRYVGGWGSTIEKINKTPVTDSFYKLSGGEFDCRPSDEGGPHWVGNFRSFHTGGAYFVFCDGAVHFISDSIEDHVYRGLSTIQGREVVVVP